MSERLKGQRILILEARQEAQFAGLLAEQGADVVRCPLVAISDPPDTAPIEAWIGRAIAAPFDDLVLTTGEGLRRLVQAAARLDVARDFVASIGRSRTFIRGPKPGHALREIGLVADVVAETPTSDGLMALLAHADLRGHRIGVQLYPEKDHGALLGAITSAGATADPVTPYIYDARAADSQVLAAIDEMAHGRIDALALTSSGQVRRLIDVAHAHQCGERLLMGFAQTPIASIGPVVCNELRAHGLRADIVPPDGAFFIRPLIGAIAAALNGLPSERGSQR
jgi:uroporphyrinogen-III synthase